MDDLDLRIRKATYRTFVELGRAPHASEVAEATGVGEQDVRESWRRLHEAHALVLDEAGEIRMAAPFSAVPTDFRVEAAGRSWFANCAWDAFGIGAAMHVDSAFETHCADCGESVTVQVRGGRADDASLLFNVPLPATQWWNDIGFT